MEEVSTITRVSLFFLGSAALAPAARAHRLDECLRSTLVSIEPGDIRLHVQITPGAAAATREFERIDGDRDGALSAAEKASYVAGVRRDLLVRLDERDLVLEAVAIEFPPNDELHSGWGTIRIEFAATQSPFTIGGHRIELEHRDTSTPSVYLVNAAKPRSESIRILTQIRSRDQAQVRIEFESCARGVSAGSLAIIAVFAGLTLAGLLALRNGRNRAVRGPPCEPVPLERPRRREVWRLAVGPDVEEDAAHDGAVGEERDPLALASAVGRTSTSISSTRLISSS